MSGCPSIFADPSCGASSPAMRSMTVVLPAPEAPADPDPLAAVHTKRGAAHTKPGPMLEASVLERYVAPIDWIAGSGFCHDRPELTQPPLDRRERLGVGREALSRLLEHLRRPRHSGEQHQARHQHRKRQGQNTHADEQQQRRRHRAAEEGQGPRRARRRARTARPLAWWFRGSRHIRRGIAAPSLRQRRLEPGMKPESRAGAVLSALDQRQSAAHAAARPVDRKQRACEHDQERDRGQLHRQDRRQRQLNEQHHAGDRQMLEVADRLARSRDVVEKQRLHSGLADAARESPAAPGQRRRGAKAERRFISGLEPCQLHIPCEQQCRPRGHRADEHSESDAEPLVGAMRSIRDPSCASIPLLWPSATLTSGTIIRIPKPSAKAPRSISTNAAHRRAPA